MGIEQLRRMAKKQGYMIRKKPGEDRFMICDLERDYVVAGCEHGLEYTLTLEDVEEFLTK